MDFVLGILFLDSLRCNSRIRHFVGTVTIGYRLNKWSGMKKYYIRCVCRLVRPWCCCGGVGGVRGPAVVHVLKQIVGRP